MRTTGDKERANNSGGGEDGRLLDGFFDEAIREGGVSDIAIDRDGLSSGLVDLFSNSLALGFIERMEFHDRKDRQTRIG